MLLQLDGGTQPRTADDDELQEHCSFIELGNELRAQVARFEMIEQVAAITRESGQRCSAILVYLRERDVEGFVNEATTRIKAKVKFPPNYSFEFGGQFETLQAARIRLGIVVPQALTHSSLF